jgi:CRP/FNR family nitrogen fixation transcriptional regulator
MTAHTMKEFAADASCEQLFRPQTGQPIPFYHSGAEIYTQGENAGFLFKVAFGCVRVYRLMADGRRQICAFYLSGEVFGFEAASRHQFSAEAVGGTGVYRIRLTQEIAASSGFLPLALEAMARAQQHLLVLGRQNAAERVAAFLLDMAERQEASDRIDLPMSRGDIADYLGLTIETVSRIFTRFRRMGLIRLVGLREVEFLNRQALQDLAS